jgi:tRNA(Ile)-lysidine synthase
MIRVQGDIPREVIVACSGGVDSMAALDFLQNNHEVSVAFFDHGTDVSQKALQFLGNYCTEKDITFLYGRIHHQDRKSDESWEEYWRKKRYEYFQTINGTVITAHHLDDCVETWVWSSMHGTPKLPGYSYNNVIRPFRTTRKRDFELWCNLKNVPHVEDETNSDIKYTRNYIRHEMMPHVLRVNPGIHKNIKKKLLEESIS